MLQIQQLPTFHVLLRVYFHPLQVLLLWVYALGEDVDVFRLIWKPIADTSDQYWTIFDERNRDAQSEKAYFLYPAGLK